MSTANFQPRMNWGHTWINCKGAQLDRRALVCGSDEFSLFVAPQLCFRCINQTITQCCRISGSWYHKLFNIFQSRFLNPHIWNKAFATNIWVGLLSPRLVPFVSLQTRVCFNMSHKEVCHVTQNPDVLKVNKGVKIVVWVAAVATQMNLKNHYENTEHREVWKCLCGNKCLLPIKR